MNKITYSYRGQTFDARIIHYNDEDYVVAPTGLLDVLQPNPITEEDDGFADKAAEEMYNSIFYFTDRETLKLSDEEIIEELKESNPDIFGDEE